MSLNNKLARKFRKAYHADLLPVALNNIKLGDVVEWDGLLKKSLDFEEYCLVEHLKISETEKANLKQQLHNVEPTNAEIQQIKMDSSYDFKLGFDIPNFATQIGITFGNANFVSFIIDDVKCKAIKDDLKVALMHIIENAKEEDKKYYRTKLKKLCYIDKLFYAGNVSIEMKNTDKIKLEAALSKAKIVNPNFTLNNNGTIKVTYAGNTNIPFAANIEPLNDFIN